MGNSPYMPKLAEDETAFVVHGGGDFFPVLDLPLRMDARGEVIALSHGVYPGAFGDDESSRGALTVVLYE